MKFLCVACDEPMKLDKADRPDDGGSIAALFTCPACANQIAMLTNPHETQLVQSLGVRIGPGQPAAAAEAGGCPFSGMLAEMEAAAAENAGPTWTPEALARLENIPELVRPMARQGIEHYARENGHATIDDAVMEEARGQFGM